MVKLIASGVIFPNGQNVTKAVEEASNIGRDRLSYLLVKVENPVREKHVKKENAMRLNAHVSKCSY